MNNTMPESEVRNLRDRVFDQVSTDPNWRACREKWMLPNRVAWLIEHDFPLEEAWKRKGQTRTRIPDPDEPQTSRPGYQPD